jgi:hypothetical protein|eukprot:jgi/Chrpa1/8809/Chrysochromulina_OHIO_Genome00016564-RA
MPCHNAVSREAVLRTFEAQVAAHYVGQQQTWHYVSAALESYTGGAPRATCSDWTVHFTGPSGSGKTFLAELIGNAAFEPWGEEAYDIAQYGVASGGGALGAALGWMVGGPLGVGLGATAGGLAAQKVMQAAMSSESLGFRVPHPFPSQCGVLQHKFSRGSSLAEVRQWEYRVAQELRRDPTSIIVVDDIGRLRDAQAFEHFGTLLCGVGGNSIPEFRAGPEPDAPLVPAGEALFVLTSDLELDETEISVSCETDAWEPMLDAVRAQSGRFWQVMQLPAPDWWQQISLVPFRELCADELAEVTRKYLERQIDLASRQVKVSLQRSSSWVLGAQRMHRWTGSIRHGPRALAALDAYVGEIAARSKLEGGRQGGWIVADFDRQVMKPAQQALASTSGEHAAHTLLYAASRPRVETTWLNYTTFTHTTSLCLEVIARDDAPGVFPRVQFSPMRHLCT